jgi:hypothetical protein
MNSANDNAAVDAWINRGVMMNDKRLRLSLKLRADLRGRDPRRQNPNLNPSCAWRGWPPPESCVSSRKSVSR